MTYLNTQASQKSVWISMFNCSKLQQQEYYELLPEYTKYEKWEYKYLKQNIGFALFGPPSEITVDYSSKTDDIIDETHYKPMFQAIIDKIFDQVRKNGEGAVHKECIYFGIIFNITLPTKDNSSMVDNDEKFKIDCQATPIFKIKRIVDNVYNNVLRTSKTRTYTCEDWYIDAWARLYRSWAHYKETNILHPCIMVIPKDGFYQPDPTCDMTEEYSTAWLEVLESPACSIAATVVNGVDKAATAIGAVSVVLGVASMFTPAAPLVMGAVVTGAASGVWSTGRAVHNLVDRNNHQQSINITEREALCSWLSIAGGALSAAAAGGNLIFMKAIRNGSNINSFMQFAYNTIIVSNLGVNGCGVAYNAYCMYEKYQDGGTIAMYDLLSLGTHVLFFGNAVMNFQFAGDLIKSTQGRILDDYRTSLRSKRLRKAFNRAKRNAQASTSDTVTQNAEVIRYINKKTELQLQNNLQSNSNKSSKNNSENTSQNTSKSNSQSNSNNSSKNNSESTPKNNSENTSQNTSKNTSQSNSNNSSKNNSESTPKNNSQSNSNNIPKNNSENTSQNTSKNTSQSNSNNSSKNNSQSTPKSNSQSSSESNLKNISKNNSENTSQNTSKSNSQSNSNNSSKNNSESTPKNNSQSNSNNIPKNNSENTSQNTSKNTSQSNSNNSSKNNSQSTPKSNSQSSSESNLKNISKNNSENTSQNTSKSNSQSNSNNSSKNNSGSTPKNNSQSNSNNIPKNNSENTSQNTSKNTSQSNSNNSSKNNSQSTPKSNSQSSSESNLKNISKNNSENTSQITSKGTSQSNSNNSSKNNSQSTPKSNSQSSSKNNSSDNSQSTSKNNSQSTSENNSENILIAPKSVVSFKNGKIIINDILMLDPIQFVKILLKLRKRFTRNEARSTQIETHSLYLKEDRDYEVMSRTVKNSLIRFQGQMILKYDIEIVNVPDISKFHEICKDMMYMKDASIIFPQVFEISASLIQCVGGVEIDISVYFVWSYVKESVIRSYYSSSAFITSSKIQENINLTITALFENMSCTVQELLPAFKIYYKETNIIKINNAEQSNRLTR